MIDLKQSTVSGIQSACKVFAQDLEAIPAEAFTQSFGPKTRTIADIVYEFNLVNDHVGMVIRGEEPFVWPEGGWIKAPIELNSKEAIVESFQQSSAKVIQTAEDISLEELETTVSDDHGTSTKLDRFRFIMLHLWYHSGQLNFIQTLLGDDEWHWK